jgi:hypothetical protein
MVLTDNLFSTKGIRVTLFLFFLVWGYISSPLIPLVENLINPTYYPYSIIFIFKPDAIKKPGSSKTSGFKNISHSIINYRQSQL